MSFNASAQESTYSKERMAEVEKELSQFDLEDDDGDNYPSNPATFPISYKIIALVCIIAFPIGQNWTVSSLGPLKNTMRKELGIDNTQFGVITSADSFINTFWPIIGGILLDWYGATIVTPLCTGIILIGSIVNAAGVNVDEWRMLAGGNVLMGLGVAVLDSVQLKLLYHWFGPAGLALAFGFTSAADKATSLVSQLVAIPLRDNTGWYGWTFWVGALLCTISLLTTMGYLLFQHFVVPKSMRLVPSRHTTTKSEIKPSRFPTSTLLNLPWVFWMLPMTQILQSGANSGFNSSSADLIHMKGYSEQTAANLSSLDAILPIIFTPLLGWTIDKYGHRFHYIAAAPLFWITACSLLGFTNIHPAVALMSSSIGITMSAMPLQICIPLLVKDQHKLGTALGIWRAFNNSGNVIVDIVFGAVQDHTIGGGYDKVLGVSMGLKAWALVVGLGYIFVDYKRLGRSLTMGRKEREAKEEVLMESEVEEKIWLSGEESSELPHLRRRVDRRVTIAGLGLLGVMIVVAWTLFLRYLI